MQTHRRLAITVLGATLAVSACSRQHTAEPPTLPAAAPAADFLASETLGNAPLMVDFTDLSSDATGWLWDFGDGQVSAEQSPQHVYEAPGTYSVKLTASGPGGSDVETKAGLIQAVATIADAGLETQSAGAAPSTPWTVFAGTPTGTAGHVVRSTAGGDPADNGMPTQGVKWLEVSAQSTDSVPPPSTVPFAEGGSTPTGPAGVTQVIRLSATHTVLQFDAAFVNGEGVPTATFNDWMSIDVSDGVDAHNLFFRDTFSGTTTSSSIHGGATVTPVTHVAVDLAQLFPSATTLTDLTLTIQAANFGDGSVDSFAYVDNLRLVQPLAMPLDAEFIVSQRVGGVGTPFRFTDMTTGAAPKAWIWDFGDGTASVEEEPDKVYGGQGMFDVTLTAMTPGSSDVETKEAFVLVDDSVCETAAFQIVTTGGNCQGTGTTVEFQNDSVNADSYVWDFGDGTMVETASAGNQMHTYNSPGDFDVTLTALGPCFGEAMTPPSQVTDTDTLDIVDPPSGANVSFSMTSPFGTGVTCSPPGFSNDKAAYRQETVRFTASNSNPNTGTLTYSWNFGDGSSTSGAQVDHAFNVAATRTVTLTATNCAGSVQVQQTIKVVQDWETVYGYIDQGVNGCNTVGCHTSSNIMNLNGQTTAYNAIRNVNTVNSCTGLPSKRVSIACSGSTSNSALSALVWALDNDVCGNGVMSSNCGCLNPVTNATQVNELRDWIDFGSPNN